MSIDFTTISLKDLAAFIYDTLNRNGIEIILVGGACVSIYSNNRYQSYDLDFVTYEELKTIESVLQKHGFRRVGRCFSNSSCPYIIDFVNPPVAIGNESIKNYETLRTATGMLKLLTPTDCVKDRLCSFFHWNDEQALEQAILVASDQNIDLTNIKRWAKKENHEEKFALFLAKLQK